MRHLIRRQAFAAQFIFLMIALTSCNKSVPFPEELIGTWVSEHEQYKKKFIVISRDAVSFGGDEGINLTAFVRDYRKEESEGEWTLFCEDKEGVPYDMFLVVSREKGDVLLKMKNRRDVIWKKLKLDAVALDAVAQTQLNEQKTPVAKQESEQADLKKPLTGKITANESEIKPVEGGAQAGGTEQEKQKQKPETESGEISRDQVETRPVEGGAKAVRLQQQPERNQEAAQQPQIKPMQPRKVVLGFKPDSTELTDEARTVLHQFLANLKQYPRATVWVKGFVAAKTNSAENIELSMKRAQAVEQLMFQAGIDPIQVERVGMGNKAPIASNDTRTGREKNRRVEIIVISDGTELR